MPALKTLDGYPAPIGYSKASVFPHVGPVSYTQCTPVAGTIPMVGGDTVQAIEAGLKYFDSVQDAYTDDGAFVVEAVPTTVSNPASGVTSGIPSLTFKLRWTSRVTAAVGGQNQTAGNEVVAGTNLSAICVRLTAFGPK